MFMWPPRPEKAIPPSMIGSFEDRGYIAQVKYNGTLQVIDVSPSGNVTFHTRHNEPNKAWKPPVEMAAFFARFPDSVFVGELLHSKHASVKNTIILFDVLTYLGKSLVGTTLRDRLALLSKIESPMDNIRVIETHDKNLSALYDSLSKPTEEGIVLKDPKSVLRPCWKDGLNAGWQTKVRRATKNYSF